MKLHQMLAYERDVRKRTQAEMTEMHRQSSEPRFATGISKRYQPIEEDGVQYPEESSPVALAYGEAIRRFREAWLEEADLVLAKDMANLKARADVEIDGEVLLEDVPATHLLFLEKHLEHVRTFVSKLVELAPGTTWQFDPEAGLHRTSERMTHRTEKIPKPIVLYDATEKHPAQTQLLQQDVIVGHWYTVNYSGAIPPERKREILRRLARLLDAVKAAREKANTVEIDEFQSEGILMHHVFGS